MADLAPLIAKPLIGEPKGIPGRVGFLPILFRQLDRPKIVLGSPAGHAPANGAGHVIAALAALVVGHVGLPCCWYYMGHLHIVIIDGRMGLGRALEPSPDMAHLAVPHLPRSR